MPFRTPRRALRKRVHAQMMSALEVTSWDASVAELADAPGLGPGLERGGSSSLPARTATTQIRRRIRCPHEAVWSQIGHNGVEDQRDAALRGIGLHPGVDVLIHVAGD